MQVAVDSYISAVSLNESTRILDMSAPFQRELMQATTPEARLAVEKKYRDAIERGYVLWEAAKGSGRLELDPMGVALIRAIGLGKEGAAAYPIGSKFLEGRQRAVVTTRAITNYEAIGWDSLPAGGRMYLLGMPFGTVVNFATGFDDPRALTLMATVDLQWTLVQMPGAGERATAPGPWLIESVEPLTGTATAWTPRPRPSP